MVLAKWLKRRKTLNPNLIDLMNFADTGTEGWNI